MAGGGEAGEAVRLFHLASTIDSVFGLPGNPVSTLVSYELFARPAVRLMAGHHSLERPRLPALAASDMRRQPDGRLHLVRVTVKAGPGASRPGRPGGRARTSYVPWRRLTAWRSCPTARE